MADDEEGWPMSPGTPQIEVNAHCTSCNQHVATMVCVDGADYERVGHVATEVARHDPTHAIAYTVETLAEALARREQEAVERQAADALAHEQMLTRARERPIQARAGLVWPF